MIQDGQGRPGRQQGLVFMLPVDIHQLAGQTAEHIHRHLPFIHESLALAPGRHLPPEEQGVFPQIQVQFPQDIMDRFQSLDVEHRLDPVGIRPRPQVVHTGPAAQHNAEGIDRIRISRSRFPR